MRSFGLRSTECFFKDLTSLEYTNPAKFTDLQNITIFGASFPALSAVTIHWRHWMLSWFWTCFTSRNRFGRSLHVEITFKDFDRLQLLMTSSVRSVSMVALNAKTGKFWQHVALNSPILPNVSRKGLVLLEAPLQT
jgi:hypothetical protein